MILRRYIRKLALWLRAKTDAWIVPACVHCMVDSGDYPGALQAVAEAERMWPGDPELTHVRTLISFLSDER